MKILRNLLLGLMLYFGFSTVVLANDHMVNVNTASAEELAEGLSGIGVTKALAIVKYREDNGYFSTPEGLTQIKGIGQKTVDKLRDQLEFDVPLEYELKKKGND